MILVLSSCYRDKKQMNRSASYMAKATERNWAIAKTVGWGWLTITTAKCGMVATFFAFYLPMELSGATPVERQQNKLIAAGFIGSAMVGGGFAFLTFRGAKRTQYHFNRIWYL